MPLLPLGPFCPLQTMLLSDLVGFDSPLQIEMAVWPPFLELEARQTAIIVSSGLSHPTGWAALHSENISILDGKHCPLRTYHEVFLSRAEKPSKDITLRLLLMHMKGLKSLKIKKEQPFHIQGRP